MEPPCCAAADMLFLYPEEPEPEEPDPDPGELPLYPPCCWYRFGVYTDRGRPA